MDWGPHLEVMSVAEVQAECGRVPVFKSGASISASQKGMWSGALPLGQSARCQPYPDCGDATAHCLYLPQRAALLMLHYRNFMKNRYTYACRTPINLASINRFLCVHLTNHIVSVQTGGMHRALHMSHGRR